MIDELDWVRSQRPPVDGPSPQDRRRARQTLEETIGPGRRRRTRWFGSPWLSPGNLAAGAALLVVVAVVAVFLGASTRRAAAPAAPGGPELVFRAEPSARAHGVSGGAVGQAATLLEELAPAMAGRVAVTSVGDQVVVHLSQATSTERLAILSLVAVTGRLGFHDWEVDTITSTGQSVAARLTGQDHTALSISQGDASAAPGSPGAGSLALYPAVRLAADQPASASAANSRQGPEYFAFAKARSSACAMAARDYGVLPSTTPTGHCYLAGPASTANQLTSLLPPGISPSGMQVLTVPAGTTVLEAVATSFSHPMSLADPSAQFYVLRDRPGVLGTSITNPATGTDPSGQPDISFGFTSRGATSFQKLTAQIARRGDLVSGVGETLDQHFAVALGNQLVTVPSIDFKTYPDGISARGGADITGGFTRRSIHSALLEVRLGSLPITLRLVSAG